MIHIYVFIIYTLFIGPFEPNNDSGVEVVRHLVYDVLIVANVSYNNIKCYWGTESWCVFVSMWCVFVVSKCVCVGVYGCAHLK